MTGQIRNCKRCAKLFVFVGLPICPDCLAKEEEQYRKVKLYLDDHQGASVVEVSDGTGVPADVVVEFLRQGLLVKGNGPDEQLVCMVCKKPITRGRLCPKCEAALGNMKNWTEEQRSNARKNPEEQARSRMYTLDSIGRKSI